MTSSITRMLSPTAGVRLCADAQRHQLTDELGDIQLPEDHVNLLVEANGVAVFHGYFRLFGVGCGQCRNLVQWNSIETWRFAWPSKIDSYVMFGETAWGDQYAYAAEDLARGRQTVFLLDALEMQPEEIASNFEEFLNKEFIRCAREPYDSMLRSSFLKFGPIEWQNHITYIPSLLLGGVEDVANVRLLDARANMIINGDIATQVSQRDGGTVERLENYIDDEGRLRIRIVWATE